MLVKFKITSIWLNERKGRADISEMKWIIAKQNSTTLQCLQAWYDHHKRLSIKKIHNVCVYRHKQFLQKKVVLCFINILMFNIDENAIMIVFKVIIFTLEQKYIHLSIIINYFGFFVCFSQGIILGLKSWMVVFPFKGN